MTCKFIRNITVHVVSNSNKKGEIRLVVSFCLTKLKQQRVIIPIITIDLYSCAVLSTCEMLVLVQWKLWVLFLPHNLIIL